MEIGGTPGGAMAILHEGTLVDLEYLGLRRPEKQLAFEKDHRSMRNFDQGWLLCRNGYVR